MWRSLSWRGTIVSRPPNDRGLPPRIRPEGGMSKSAHRDAGATWNTSVKRAADARPPLPPPRGSPNLGSRNPDRRSRASLGLSEKPVERARNSGTPSTVDYNQSKWRLTRPVGRSWPPGRRPPARCARARNLGTETRRHDLPRAPTHARAHHTCHAHRTRLAIRLGGPPAMRGWHGATPPGVPLSLVRV